MGRKVLIVSMVIAFFGIFSGCSREPDPVGPQYGTKPLIHKHHLYKLAVHPLHNPRKLNHDFQPLIDYLNRNFTSTKLVLEASRDYANFEEKYGARTPEFLLPNPWQTLQAIKTGYRVIAMAGEPEDFKGIFVTRRDSGIQKPADLKGKAISYPSSTALAACIMPQYFLHQHRINITTDIKNHYVGSQESSIMNAYLGHTAVGVTWPVPWRAFQKEFPREADKMKVIWETPHLINNSFMVRDDVPLLVVEKIRTLLLHLHDSPEGRAILANMELARFVPAGNANYEVVKLYIQKFEKEVRPVEMK